MFHSDVRCHESFKILFKGLTACAADPGDQRLGAICGHSSIQVAEPPLRGALWGGNAGRVVLEGLLAGWSAEVSPTGLPSNKMPKPGGAGGKGRAGDSFATGLQSFMQKICSRQCPQTTPGATQKSSKWLPQ